MTSQRPRRRDTLLQPSDIIDTAVDLTQKRGLNGWSVRDINKEIGASMSSIYHHVGGKDEIARRVVEHVLKELSFPPLNQEWQECFLATLMSARETLSRYPGVAHWMLMHGPIFAHSMTGLDTMIGMLQRAGFGDQAGLVYATIFNAALANIATADDRKQHAEDGPRDHASIMERLKEHSDDSPGGQVILSTIAPFAATAQAAEEAARTHYRFLVTSLIAGIDQQPR